jgi:hypothetical protein
MIVKYIGCDTVRRAEYFYLWLESRSFPPNFFFHSRTLAAHPSTIIQPATLSDRWADSWKSSVKEKAVFPRSWHAAWQKG